MAKNVGSSFVVPIRMCWWVNWDGQYAANRDEAVKQVNIASQPPIMAEDGLEMALRWP